MKTEEKTNSYDTVLGFIYFVLVFIIIIYIFFALFCNNNNKMNELLFSITESPINNNGLIMNYPNFAIKK